MSRSVLPYGVVMATGGASRLAQPAGLPWLAGPLLVLAIVQAVTIAALAIRRHHRTRDEPRPEWQRMGEFTVPLGLAVIGSGLAESGAAAARVLAWVFVGSAWLATAYLLVAVAIPVATHRLELHTVGGAWFLVPAALLGDAIGAAVLGTVGSPAGTRTLLGAAAVACVVGVVGYWPVACVCGVRCLRLGTGPQGRVAWWIAAGCGGLAAAAVGAVTPGVAGGWQLWAALASWLAGTVLLVPVVSASISHVLRSVRLGAVRGRPVWPPAFSTAVYALGSIQAGRLSGIRVVGVVGVAAARTGLVLWAVTAAIWIADAARRAGRR